MTAMRMVEEAGDAAAGCGMGQASPGPPGAVARRRGRPDASFAPRTGSGDCAPFRPPPPPGWRERVEEDNVAAAIRHPPAGRLTQWSECLPYKEEVGGSNTSSPTSPCAAVGDST